MTFGDILDEVASTYPNKTAVKSESASLTYAELRGRVAALSNAFLASGLRQGERVAVLAPNCHQYLELYLAAFRTGIILVPFNTRLATQEMDLILNDCRPSAFVVEEEFLGCFEALRRNLPSVKLLLYIGAPLQGSLDYEEAIKRVSREFSGGASEEDVVSILYTGGTTGLPKGVMLTNRTWVANTLNTLPMLPVKPEGVNLVMTPLFHTAAVWPALLHLYAGGSTVVPRRFEVKPILEIMEKERVTFCHPVLSQVISMVEHPDAAKHDLSSLHTIQCSMSLSLPAFQRALKVFGNNIVPGYGLTEAGPMVSLMPREEMASWGSAAGDGAKPPKRFGSSGIAAPNVEIRLVDGSGADVPRGEVGEITVRSRSIMKGYWNRPDATAQALRNGWLYTGDLARMDDNGFLFFVDRKSGMIKTGGENVYPKEVEDAIASHPAVLEVAVFGIPHEKWGETVKAVVALRRGSMATAEELIGHCRQRIASYKRPTSIDFVDCLPRNPSGKVIKAELRAIPRICLSS